MDLKAAGLIIGMVLFSLVIAGFLQENDVGEQGAFGTDKTLFQVLPTQTSAGEKVNVSARAFNAGNLKVQKIEVEFAGEKKEIDCSKSSQEGEECVLIFDFLPLKGLYFVKATFFIASGEKLVKTERLVVNEKRNSCLNGLEFGSCSENGKPFYCNSGVLEENCGKCGCNAGFYCSASKCLANPGKIELQKIEMPSRSQALKEFSAVLRFKALEKLLPGNEYLVEAFFDSGRHKKTFNTTFRINSEMQNGSEFSQNMEKIVLPEGSYDVNFSVYALSPGKEKVSGFFAKSALQPLENLPELDAPQILGVFAEGKDAVISWAKVEGAKSYRLYKSVDVNPVFISYKFHSNFEGAKTSGVAQGLGGGTHFFVLTAVDEFGNESGYSNAEQVSIGS